MAKKSIKSECSGLFHPSTTCVWLPASTSDEVSLPSVFQKFCCSRNWAAGDADLPQLAPSRADIQTCGKIDDDLSRLACFDALHVRVQGAPSVSPPVRGVGLWEVSTGRSQIDDSTSVTALLTASQPVGTGYRQPSPTVVAHCKEGDLDFYTVWDVFVGSGKHPVTMRLDADDARIDTWSVSTDHKATFYSGKVTVLFEALAKAKKLVVRTTPFGESPVMTSFDVSGFANVRPAILKACGL